MSAPIGIVVLALLAVLFGWLAFRAARSANAFVRWAGGTVSGLLAVVFLVVGALGLLGLFRLHAVGAEAAPELEVRATAEQLARGESLAHMCAGCHSSTGDLPLDGGSESFLPSALAVLYAPNLTPAGPLATWSDGEIIRAMREGVHKNGRGLLIMPAEFYRFMSDADAQAVVAYLRSQPAVDHDTPANHLNLVGAVLVGAGILPTTAQSPVTKVEAPPEGPTAEYGGYLVSISGCTQCHGQDLQGGTPGGFVPVGPSLVAVVPSWSAEGFVRTLQTGTTPMGRQLSDEMPWRQYAAAYSAEELAAIGAYIRELAQAD